jgi:hypothetical protein
MRDVPEEVSFFARSAAFALVIATIYWFVSYEPAGTTLLAFFGLASGLAAIVLFRGWRGSVGGTARGTEAPFTDESGRIPTDTLAPLEVGFGLAVAALGLVFGAWLILAAILPITLGSLAWLHAAGEELDAIETSEPRAEGRSGRVAESARMTRRP